MIDWNAIVYRHWKMQVEAKSPRPLVYSFSLLNAYRNCGHAMYRRYIKKDIPFVETEAMAHGNRVHSAFEGRLAHGKPLPDDLKRHETLLAVLDHRNPRVETKLAITRAGQLCGYFDDKAWLRGKIDVYFQVGDRAIVFDWKTGNSRFEDPFELEIGALLLRAQYRDRLKQVRGNYVYLKENKTSREYDLSDFAATWKQVITLVKRIENERAIDEFEKRQSGLCKFCEVRDCEFNRNANPRGA